MGTWRLAGVMKAEAGQQSAPPGSPERRQSDIQAQTPRRYMTLALMGQSVYRGPVRWL